jgi:hypothetical protein
MLPMTAEQKKKKKEKSRRKKQKASVTRCVGLRKKENNK